MFLMGHSVNVRYRTVLDIFKNGNVQLSFYLILARRLLINMNLKLLQHNLGKRIKTTKDTLDLPVPMKDCRKSSSVFKCLPGNWDKTADCQVPLAVQPGEEERMTNEKVEPPVPKNDSQL